MSEDLTHEDAHIDVRRLDASRNGRVIFDDLSCRFPRGRISVVLGGSGVGKSTLLRMLGCLARPQVGEIWVDGETELTCMPERQAHHYRRRIGMMFQAGALLDSMTVFENLALPLREHTRRDPEAIAQAVHAACEAVGLKDVDGLLPGELSGGMMRRVALARALILEPQILLCDEPLSGLDPQNIRRVESLLVELNRRLGLTMIVTSHHIDSTLRIADWIVVLADGKALCGSREELPYLRDPRVTHFFEETGPCLRCENRGPYMRRALLIDEPGTRS